LSETDQDQVDGTSAEPLELWNDSQAAFRDRNYERAAELMQTLLARWGEGGGVDPSNVRLQLGISLLRLKRTEEGVAELERAVQLDPYNGRTRYKLGIGLARLGRNAEALASLELAVRLAPDVADHQWRLAEELRRQGRRFGALNAVRWCLELQPDHTEGLATLAALKKEGWIGWGLERTRTFLGVNDLPRRPAAPKSEAEADPAERPAQAEAPATAPAEGDALSG
jgi:tetratricopeptide (TPR) repeat protein